MTGEQLAFCLLQRCAVSHSLGPSPRAARTHALCAASRSSTAAQSAWQRSMRSSCRAVALFDARSDCLAAWRALLFSITALRTSSLQRGTQGRPTRGTSVSSDITHTSPTSQLCYSPYFSPAQGTLVCCRPIVFPPYPLVLRAYLSLLFMRTAGPFFPPPPRDSFRRPSPPSSLHHACSAGGESEQQRSPSMHVIWSASTLTHAA